MIGRALAMAALLLAAAPAPAAVVSNDAGAFTTSHAADLPVAPATVWAALVRWQAWWPPAHSYSGSAPTLDVRPGGALSESWAGGHVLHATVLAALPPRLLRLQGGFGPLQGLPVTAVLEFTLAPGAAPGSTRLVMTYRVAGPASAGLPAMAPAIDSVMGEGFGRLVRLATPATP
ncbi:SRPBCC family protein [Sandarakinorhabdus sp.]|uniref:SRPBCC family protein n=1 Tax=Sandarakinorhabdus sp. TaxID=1916663 RepID=UPI00286D97AD|nr:SRPBCC family protein [Sandarakinorhabdus sp.]